MNPPLTPQSFVQRWRAATLTERASAQSHFIDLCHLLGVPTPTEADPTGASYAFEKGATKQAGGQGWADVWKRGAFAWEYKRKGRDLAAAYQQLLQYREALENPPLLVVSDIATIEIHTNFTSSVKRVYTIALDDLLDPRTLETLRHLWSDPDAFRAPQTTQQVTEEAAREFARLAEVLREWGAAPDHAARFLIRLLFCLFAEDVGLLPKALFSRLLAHTRERPEGFTRQLQSLFGEMRGGGFFGSDPILHFNGGLFDDDAVLPLPRHGLTLLDHVSRLDWSSVEPAIFGTLFERSLDPAKRSQLGAHYTAREDILLIVEPVLMAPLRRRWEDVQAEAHALARERDAADGPRKRDSRQQTLAALLTGFAQEIASVRVLDPACGSGNFLYVALKQLLDLEKEVIVFAGAVGVGRFFPSVSPEQLRGIEVNEYAHELAQATIWIGYIQWLRDNGFGLPAEPILKPLHTIWRMDALLAQDEQGQPVEPSWPDAEVIIGNPPFLGDKKMRGELGDGYVETLRALYAGRVPGGADLVTYWFERARALIEGGKVQRAGLLATNSIRGGSNRTVLQRIKGTGNIFVAWSDHPWVLDGAAVRVSLVGFDDGSSKNYILDGQAVPAIHADLTGVTDLTQAQGLAENQGLSFIGTQKSGPFDLTETEARAILGRAGNPNGRPNSDVVKRWINGLDLTRRPRGMWIINFGTLTEEEAAQYEAPFEYLRQRAQPARAQMRATGLREHWWLLSRARPAMQEALRDLPRYIATPRVAKHRLFVHVFVDTVPDTQVVVIARADDYFLGVLHAKPHELWALRQGTSLEDRPRYSPTATFETYPFPWPPGAEPPDDPCVQAIAAAARDLVEKRERWLNPEGASAADLKKRTLTALYNQRPTWLALAHQRLDAAVLAAYGWDATLTDEEILANLLALNLARAGQG